jgi:hypothetical protein
MIDSVQQEQIVILKCLFLLATYSFDKVKNEEKDKFFEYL